MELLQKISLILLLLLTQTVSALDTGLPMTHLPEPLLSGFKRHGFTDAGISIYIHRIGRKEPLLLVSPDIPRNPASVIKLVTTAAALAELGPGYTWKTEVYADGPIRDGQLTGNLYIKGYGDPYMTPEFFWRLLRNIRSSGINHITGDLVLDVTYFKPKLHNPAAFDGQAHRTYNVNPNALLVNYQAVRFRFLPVRKRRIRINVFPNPHTFDIESSVVATRGRCRNWASRLRMEIVSSESGRDKVQFSGSIPASCGSRDYYRVISDPIEFFEGVFRTLWREQGGTLAGKVRLAKVNGKLKLVYTARSLPLSDLVRGINKYSNNVMTRQLLLTMGAEKYGSPGTEAKGKRVIIQWLRRHNLAYPELVLDNGIGLSRKVRISARHLGTLLLLAYSKPFMAEYMSSLPVSGVDGTMHRRFANSKMKGHLHIKTGSLDNVRSMAGYLMDRRGRRYVVVMIHNHHRAHLRAGERIQNVVLKWLFNRSR
ncbi:MAG: D-alanyl-D-alanine carboxypeptidase/D-alanyl-D-alanine-endopeptidase [Gammaproteobacteria bacterium]|nr:MAG: D-alanyl-D-alanine carboxypeptidase/D-alanyl-D-alanine-endopeptidase [Gammaproteobacteria bacterium]